MESLYPILQGLQNMLSSNWRRNTAGMKTNKQTKNMASIWLVSVAQSTLHKRAGDETETDFIGRGVPSAHLSDYFWLHAPQPAS